MILHRRWTLTKVRELRRMADRLVHLAELARHPRLMTAEAANELQGLAEKAALLANAMADIERRQREAGK